MREMSLRNSKEGAWRPDQQDCRTDGHSLRTFWTFRERKTNEHKQTLWSRDCMGGKIVFMCFGHPLWRRKAHKQNPPEDPGQSREKFVYVFFSLCVFCSLPRIAVKFYSERTSGETKSPEDPGQSREKFVYVFCLFVCFFAPNLLIVL